MYDDREQTKEICTMFLGGFFDGIPGYASLCKECGEKCPQGLLIRENLKKVAEYFGVTGEGYRNRITARDSRHDRDGTVLFYPGGVRIPSGPGER
jgi:hypothetical protein